jgi:hypothetical protein
MFRFLHLFPGSADAAEVERIVTDELAPAMRRSEGFVSFAVSVGAPMGPGAADGSTGLIAEADFESLDTAMAAISVPSFQPVVELVDALGPEIFLFEFREL